MKKRLQLIVVSSIILLLLLNSIKIISTRTDNKPNIVFVISRGDTEGRKAWKTFSKLIKDKLFSLRLVEINSLNSLTDVAKSSPVGKYSIDIF